MFGLNTGLLGVAAAVRGAFDPSSLFASGEQGAWYDPSDLSTMFQDSAGTTPVTADGQPVGLILDKSQGLALGPELATNGDFSNGTTGWVPNTGVSLSNVSNQLVQTSTSIGWLSSFLHVTGVTPGNTYKISIDVVGGSVSSSRYLNVGTNAGGYNIFQTQILSNGTLVCYATATQNYFDIGTECLFTNVGDTVILDNFSVKLISGNHATQATAASRPLYKTDGTYHWLQFDGVDDSLSTGNINFTSTDKMSVFAGAHKNNDTLGIIAEISLSVTNVGMFYLAVNDGLLDWSSLSRGSVDGNGGQAASFTQTGAAKAVLSSKHDIAGDLTTLRKNTVSATDATADKGTGNFGNYPLYIGARATTSFFLSGNIYSLIIRGALSTADEITATETWVNGKTGAY